MRHHTSIFLGICGLTISAAQGASAQRVLPDIQPGTRVRVESATARGKIAGTFLFSRSDTLTILARSGDSVRFPHPDLTRIQDSRGRSRVRGALKGAALGLLIGPLALGGLGAIGDAGGADEGQTISGTAVGVMFGAVIGPVAGAVLGAVRGSERWRTHWELR